MESLMYASVGLANGLGGNFRLPKRKKGSFGQIVLYLGRVTRDLLMTT